MTKSIAFFPAHPSQVWLLKSVSDELSLLPGLSVHWVMRDKDVTCSLADMLGIKYKVVSKASTGLIGNAVEMFLNIFRCWSFSRKHRIDVWVTKYGSGNIAAFLSGGSSIAFNDDDIDQVPLIAHSSYPFASCVVCPDVLRMGRYESKALRYPGCHELFYLHPNRFRPDSMVLQELGIKEGQKFLIVRLSALTAHHDKNIRGLSNQLVHDLICLCKELSVTCFISSEKELDESLAQYRLSISVDRVHHVLAFADLFVGDSQTMTSEAAVLGTPALRFSDFIGRLSVIDELERYELATGLSPDESQRLLKLARSYLDGSAELEEFKERHKRFLNEKSDPVPLFVNQIKTMLGMQDKQ